MENDQLLSLYEKVSIKNLPKAEALLSTTVTHYLRTSSPNDVVRSALHNLLEGLLIHSSINNMESLFIRETQGKLSDLSISISTFFSEGGDLGHIFQLLSNLKVACARRGLTDATELVSSIEFRLQSNSPSDRIPTLQTLSILASMIESGRELEGLEAAQLSAFSQEKHGRPLDEPHPFIRSKTVSQNVLEQRILIVEDESVIASTIGFVLSDLDLPIDVVSDGAAALDQLNARPYSLVISDIEMPNFDGFSLIDAMKRDDQLRDLPVVFMSDKAAYRDQINKKGAAGFFLKGSIRGEELLLLISNALCDAPYVPQG